MIVFVPSTKSYAQSNTISIKINNIAYENPSLKSLKDVLKKTPRVTSLKLSYADNTAIITFFYSGTAEDVWDKITAADKKNFKMTAMEGKNIELNYISSSGTVTTAKSNNNSTQQKKDDNDCKSCVYFPFCNYDYTRTFQGKEYKGIDYDGNIVYFRYENGELISKTETFNDWGESTGFITEIKLKCNAPQGTTWRLNYKGATGSGYKEYEILKKNISLTVDGKKYDDVMVVSETVKSLLPFSTNSGQDIIASSISYYAKGVGLVKQETKNNLDNYLGLFDNSNNQEQQNK